MKSGRARVSPYLLIFFLPVALVALLAGGLNLVSFYNLRTDHLATREQQSKDIQRIKRSMAFNQEVAAIQHLVATTLEQAAAGKLDEGEVYQAHTQVVNRLATLDARLPELKDEQNNAQYREAEAHFFSYRNFIIQASDLAAIDPPMAMRHAYQAANQYLFLSEHTRAIAANLAERSEERSFHQELMLEQHARENMAIGGVLLLALMLVWWLLIHRLTRRLSALSNALAGLAAGEIDPESLPLVRGTANEPRSLLRELANAVLAFRETSLAHRVAQYELGERMKELSCLFDVSRIAQRDELPVDRMLLDVAERLPEAMRFPGIAVGGIECGGKHYGIEAEGEALVASFVGMEGAAAKVIVVYTEPVPAEAGAPFLAEERALLDAVAAHLASAIERRRVAAVERDRQALLDSVVVDAPDAIELVDAQTLCFVEVNAASCRMLGYSREEMIGMPLAAIQGMLGPDELANLARDTLAKGEAQFENRHRCKNGDLLDARVSIRRLSQNNRDYLVGIWRDITAEKAAATEIRKLSLVIEQSPNPIVITDLAGRIEYVNDAFSQNTGYLAAEVIGRTPRFLKSGKTPETTYRAMWETLTHGGIWKGEFINLTRDGREQIEESIIVPLRQSDGQISHYAAIKEDITLKKQMGDELQRHREHLEQLVASRTAELNTILSEQSALFDAASAGIVLLRDRVIVRCNRRMDEMFGYADGEQLGRETRIWYADDESFSLAGREVYPQVGRGEIHVREQEVVRKDGSRFWVRMSGHAVDVSDPSKGMVGIIEDITAERVTADALRLASEEQQAIFDTANSGIALLRDRVIQRGNRRLHEMFGWPAGTMLGKTTAIWYQDEVANALGGGEVYEQIWRGDVHRRDQELMRQDGSLFWARLTGTAVDIGDHAKGTVWVIEDISVERASIEQMRQAQALAEAAARMKSDFLANMSHEIRTPMNAIIGMSHLAMKTELNARQRDYLSKIQASSQHLLGIINDILDLSKIEAGKMVVEHIDFELDRVFENVAGLIAEKAAAKGLELIVDIDETVPRSLIGDPLRLGQILINYANNAVKFTEQGEIVIRVGLVEQTASEVMLHFSVSDTGIGIDEEQRARLFQSFEQADASTTRKFGGTGLGLAISKQLASLMAGEVGVDSEFGKGATFWFTARLGRGEQKIRNLLPDPDLRGRRVLVVDDNESARDVICDMLRAMTFRVFAAASGRQAITEVVRADADNDPYEIVFLDWQMPVMDGIQTAGEIRRHLSGQTPRLVMITAYGRDEVMRAAAEAGIEDVLIKPVTSSLLFDTVMRIMVGLPSEPQVISSHLTTAVDLTDLAGGRILLVEDNLLNQEVASELLSDAGFVVDIAENGAVALAKVKQQGVDGYDIVLMDMQMPVMDGITATREIRQLPEGADLPIVAMTANAMAGDRENCLAAGMNDHVAKPIDPEDLWTKLRQWMRLRGVRPAAPASSERATPDQHVSATAFTGIPGLDVDTGLRYTMGRDSLYISLLSMFVTGQADFPREMAAALVNADWLTAERLIHTLKGVSAQIGAKEVHQLAEQLEVMIKARHGMAEVNARLAHLTEVLAALRTAISACLQPAEEVPADAAVDRERLLEVCKKLVLQLEADDFLSTATIHEHEGLLRTSMGPLFDKFLAQAENYDHGSALALLKSFAASGELPL